MRTFDWISLFTKERIHYIERGPNVKRGEINIKCVFCGSADPSQHMGINLDTGWYSCWRQKSGHSGKSPVRLIMRLLNVDYRRAREIAGLGEDYVDPEGFDALVARLLKRGQDTNPSRQPKREFLQYDKYFLEITDRPLTLRWWNYLYTRYFEHADIPALCRQYELRAAREGNWTQRLIIPYFLDGKLVSWTGRAIGPSTIRYRDLSVDDSIVPPKETLFNHDCMYDGGRQSLLVIVEGPIDALKLDFYGRPFGVRAVALSTNSLTEHQTYMLEEAAERFPRIAVMMDNKSGMGVVDSMRRKQELFFISKLETLKVPFDRGDAGELRSTEARDWAKEQA